MNKPTLSRSEPPDGAVFAIVLTVAAGNGSDDFPVRGRSPGSRPSRSPCRSSRTYTACYARQKERTAGWLTRRSRPGSPASCSSSAAAPGTGCAQGSSLVAGTPLSTAVSAIGTARPCSALYPLRRVCAATAIVAFRDRALPRWLGAGAAVTAAALAVNGAFLGTDSFPACSFS